MLYAFKNNGDGAGDLLEATVDMPEQRWPMFCANAAANAGLEAGEVLLWCGPPLAGRLTAVIADGAVASVQAAPADPPASPEPDPLATLQTGLARLEAVVDATLTVSEHDRRWLVQKEAAKRLGIAWIKANPAAGQAEAEAALAAALAAEFPEDPLVASPAGVILSYALAAHARGHIPTPTFTALRDLVAAASQDQLAQLLAKL